MARPWFWIGVLCLHSLFFLVRAVATNDFARSILKSTTYDVRFEKNLTIPKSDALKLLRGEYEAEPELVKVEEAHGNMTLTWGDKTDYELYRITSNECYLCRYPPKHLIEEVELKRRLEPLTQSEKQEILTQGLEVFEKQRALCINHIRGYFAYQFCYNFQLRQLPAEKHWENLKTSSVSWGPADPVNNVYILGQWDEKHGRVPESMSTEEQEPKSALRPINPSSIENKGQTLYPDQSVYIEQTWGDGTVCDLNGLPRTTRVRVCHNINSVLLLGRRN